MGEEEIKSLVKRLDEEEVSLDQCVKDEYVDVTLGERSWTVTTEAFEDIIDDYRLDTYREYVYPDENCDLAREWIECDEREELQALSEDERDRLAYAIAVAWADTYGLFAYRWRFFKGERSKRVVREFEWDLLCREEDELWEVAETATGEWLTKEQQRRSTPNRVRRVNPAVAGRVWRQHR